MKPLNYAMLKYFTTVEDACVDDVMDALKGVYGHFKAFDRDSMVSAIMTAEANGLLAETRFELSSSKELKVYYCAPEEGAATINYYIQD